MISLKIRSRMGVPRILVIDDEVQLAEIYRAVLQNAGAKVKVVYDAADADEAIRAFQPDVIVSDIRMPEVRGDELLVALKEYNESLPIVLITGLDKNKVSIPKESPNLFSLLYKPVEYDQLIRSVQNALALVEARRINEALLKEIYKSGQVTEPFEEWQESTVSNLLDNLNRRAS